jgi:hypothetical protein
VPGRAADRGVALSRYRGVVPFTIVLLLLLIAGLALLGLALSGAGSPDRSHEKSPRLPGHDIQDQLARRNDPHLP